MSILVKKRVIPFIVCFSILLSAFTYRPQKADALAVTTTTAVVASVAAIMTACGVSYWANTQQDAIDYLGGKIHAYLESLSENTTTYEEWLDISGANQLFTVIGNGVLSFGSSVANKILDFVRWFNQEESVTSGGQSVGELGGSIQPVTASYNIYGTQQFVLSNDSLTMTFSGQYGSVGSNGMVQYSNRLYIPASSLPRNLNVKLESLNMQRGTSVMSRVQFEMAFVAGTNNLGGTLSYWSVNSSQNFTNTNNSAYFYIMVPTGTSSYKQNGSLKLVLSGAVFDEPDTAVITPSASVSVPSDIALGQSLVVTTNANIARDDTVEDASTAILGTVATTGGLTSTNDVLGQAVPSESIWLWDAITSLPATIAQAIGGLFVPSDDFAETFATTAYSMFDNHFSILSYPFSVLGEFTTRFLTLGNPEPIFRWGNIKDPFSGKIVISAGQYNLNDALQNQEVAEIYDLYMLLVKAFISFQFINFLYAWFCDVFKMRESDYPLPFDDADGDSDVEDGDGYDGYYSSY